MFPALLLLWVLGAFLCRIKTAATDPVWLPFFSLPFSAAAALAYHCQRRARRHGSTMGSYLHILMPWRAGMDWRVRNLR